MKRIQLLQASLEGHSTASLGSRVSFGVRGVPSALNANRNLNVDFGMGRSAAAGDDSLQVRIKSESRSWSMECGKLKIRIMPYHQSLYSLPTGPTSYVFQSMRDVEAVEADALSATEENIFPPGLALQGISIWRSAEAPILRLGRIPKFHMGEINWNAVPDFLYMSRLAALDGRKLHVLSDRANRFLLAADFLRFLESNGFKNANIAGFDGLDQVGPNLKEAPLLAESDGQWLISPAPFVKLLRIDARLAGYCRRASIGEKKLSDLNLPQEIISRFMYVDHD